MTVLISMDVEASGPCPLHGDLLSFGAVVIEEGLSQTFLSPNMRAECDKYKDDAYRVVGVTRQEHLNFPSTIKDGILSFKAWLDKVESQNGRYIMLSDNPGFDFQWMNFECFNHLGMNPLGHSARRIGDVWAGLRQRPRETLNWRKFRKTPHDHSPLNDAMGNAEAWLEMWRLYG